MAKATMHLALLALVLVGFMLAGQEADGARITPSAGVISYSGLPRRNRVNVSDAAAVRPPGEANRYTRGCSKIAGCRG
ncbi:hypothetical protein ACQ4PT_037500 [Festuca glaucescens]